MNTTDPRSKAPSRTMVTDRLRAAHQTKVTGLISYKAVIDHAIEHGLPAPANIELTDQHVRIWLSGQGKAEWGQSINVDAVDTRPSSMPDRVIVHVDGRLPFMNLRVQLVFSREQRGGHLSTVMA